MDVILLNGLVMVAPMILLDPNYFFDDVVSLFGHHQPGEKKESTTRTK
jgi:hypothetical protein